MEIEQFTKLLEEIADHYRTERSTEIDVNSIEDALYLLLSDKHRFQWRGSLWDIEITLNEALKLLSTFDFKTLDQTVETSKDVLPAALLIRYKVRIKSKGLVWVIHRYDSDPFPSNPHAHELENNLKLDLSNGKCYKNRKFIHSISTKELLEIRRKASERFKGELPPLSI